ncbi:Protein NRT1/ PTR FAMILY 4.5 [Glycine soja]
MIRTPKRGFSLIDFGCRDFKARISRSGNDVVGGEKAWEVGIHMADVDDAVAPLHYRFSPHRNRASLSEPLLPRVPLTVSSSSFSMLSESKPWMDKRVLKNVASTRPLSARIFKAIADPPTTSLQRLKGLTTGGLPTFVDVGNSFSAPAIVEDNFINQKVVMMGDDTWTQLFPHHFERSYPYPSFNVKDLHMVDNGCIEHLLLSLYEEDWDVLIAHFLGVDHAGHIFGVDSTPMIEKLEQYNTILESGPGSSHENTMLVVMGDHGQTLNGDHGGGSAEEVETAIFAMSFKKPLSFVPPEFDSCSCQLDLSIGFLILSTLCRFATEVGLSKQAATSAFMKDFTSWIINIASGLPVWDYAAEVIPMVVLILLAAWLYKAASGSFFDWPWKYVILGTILSYMLIIVHWITDSGGFGGALMPQSIGRSYIPRIIYAIALGQLLQDNFSCKNNGHITVWSSTVILLSGKQGPMVAFASIVGGALSFCALMLYKLAISCCMILQIHLCHGFTYAANICRLAMGIAIYFYFIAKFVNIEGGKDGPLRNFSIMQWSLFATCLFFCSGHWYACNFQGLIFGVIIIIFYRCAFDGLRYGAAFIGFEEFVLVRQAILLAIDTFGFSIILPVFGLPLLVATKYQANLGKHFIFTQLSQMYTTYGLMTAITTTFTILCVTIQRRRHLMVWGLFAPKFVYDVFNLILTDDLKAEAEAEANVGDVEYQARKTPRQGGYRATYFIFAMMLLDNIGFVANMVSLVLYFMNVMHFDYSGSATTTTNLLGTAFLLTIVGGFISDTYMNRLNTCILFGIIQLLGYSLLVIQSHDKTLQPDPCLKSTCVHGTKALLFYASIYLLALGGGGIRGCVPALGADQFDEKKPKEHAQLASFFNWFLFSITIGASLGVTFVVYVSTESQWYKGFIISMSCSAVGLIFIASGKRFYHARVPGESPLLRVLQVLVVTVRNWRVKVPLDSDELYEIQSHESSLKKKLIPHTNQFRVLDKAAVLPEGNEARRWKVCTVTQVEEVKILTRMMPILLSTIIMNTSLAQLQTFSIQQGTLMNTYIGKLNIPAASIPIIPLVFMTLLIPVYEFAFIPLVRRITGHPNGITELQRVGVGLVLSAISMVIAGVIEVKRKHEFNDHNQHRISLFWLSFHYAIFGIADMFTLVGLLEFFYKEAPQGMRSLSTSFSFLSLSIGYYLSTAFVELINLVTSKIGKSKKGWLEGRDLNRNHVQLFYWFLAILSLINFLIYLMCAKWYKYQSVVPFDKGMLLKDPPPRNDENVYSTSFVSTVQNIPQNEDK